MLSFRVFFVNENVFRLIDFHKYWCVFIHLIWKFFHLIPMSIMRVFSCLLMCYKMLGSLTPLVPPSPGEDIYFFVELDLHLILLWPPGIFHCFCINPFGNPRFSLKSCHTSWNSNYFHFAPWKFPLIFSTGGL